MDVDSPGCFKFIRFQPDGSAKSRDEIRVKNTSTWSYCGPLLDPQASLPSSFAEWISKCIDGPLAESFIDFLVFANAFLEERNITHYWVSLRATKPHNDYDKPRWHTDDQFYAQDTIAGDWTAVRYLRSLLRPKTTDFKLVTTLVGPPTLFIPTTHQTEARQAESLAKQVAAQENAHTCASIRCLGCATAADSVRQSLIANLDKMGSVQVEPGECAWFKIGPEEGAVHSEPPMGEGDRIFLNLVPGTKRELDGLMKKWGMRCPRDWWIGPGVLKGDVALNDDELEARAPAACWTEQESLTISSCS
jgi:hypothetical protein